MYFIPREKTKLAEEIFTKIDSLTLNYTDIHPEQRFRYTYNVKDELMRWNNTNAHDLSLMFEGVTGVDDLFFKSLFVLFGITPQGYYIAITDSENKFCIPKEWYCLKSFVDGKKEYIKGTKK